MCGEARNGTQIVKILRLILEDIKNIHLMQKWMEQLFQTWTIIGEEIFLINLFSEFAHFFHNCQCRYEVLGKIKLWALIQSETFYALTHENARNKFSALNDEKFLKYSF